VSESQEMGAWCGAYSSVNSGNEYKPCGKVPLRLFSCAYRYTIGKLARTAGTAVSATETHGVGWLVGWHLGELDVTNERAWT